MDIATIQEFLSVKADGNLKHRESQTLEFKESFNFAGLAEYFRDFAAFANNKGGWLIFGVKDRPKREFKGLSESSHDQLDKLDPEKITGYLLDIFTGNIEWEHETFEYKGLKVGAFRVYESKCKPVICKKDERDILHNGEIYFRYGGRTQKIQYAELEAIINQRIEKNNSQWIDLIGKIGKSGPQNAAVLDVDKGVLEKDSHILVIDDRLTKEIKWIKEGSFNEKEGAPALKLIGDVHPVDTLEIVKREKINRLKEYPLSARQLADKICQKTSMSKNDVFRIIKENDIKSDPNYSIYNFRNKSQEDNYEKTGFIPSGTPSIYKESTIDYIINISKNEH